MTPVLNWRELSLLVETLRPEVEGLFVDRIIVPDRPRFPSGYLKGEWAIRLTGRRSDCTLLFSIRPQHPYIAVADTKAYKASPQGTRSAFDLSIGKTLKGAKLVQLVPVPKERAVIAWFTGVPEHSKVGLVLMLIPTAPEAYLISDDERILTRSRTVREPAKQVTQFVLPDGSRAPQNPEVRSELLKNPRNFLENIETELKNEAFVARRSAAEKQIRELIAHTKTRRAQSTRAASEAQGETDWKRFGDLLKSVLNSPPPLVDGSRTVSDFETDETIRIPCDPKLSPPEQVEKFYQMARRKTRRLEEAQDRIERFEEILKRLETLLNSPPEAGNWPALEKYEGSFGAATPKDSDTKTSRKPLKHGQWLGRTFTSKDGWIIWVGKSKDENLELTFKHARGNDLWMHVRGRPGAHAVIPVQPGKSVPLETLLDAALLTVFYSGGEKWGKTEVDYTHKKYVKRIKDSTEVSYTHNKTLLVTQDPVRLKRLMEKAL